MKRFPSFLLIICLSCCLWQCNVTKNIQEVPSTVETTEKPAPKPKPVTGFGGQKYYPPEESPASKQKKDSLLAIAQANFDENPEDMENIIWLGRRTAYLWDYQKAIDIYTKGLEKHPNAPELYRHRGHRYISIRQLDKAIADFEKAAQLAEGRPIQIEQDGLPNAQNIPLSNLQFNIYYHWALAHYLKGEFPRAAELYEKCMDVSINSDLIVATVDWFYMTYRRMGEDLKAKRLLSYVDKGMKIIENQSYFKRILMYKGDYAPDDLLHFESDDLASQLDIVTQGYGVGNWYRYNGDLEKAKEVFEELLETDYWSAFGFLAAEADMKRKLK